MDTYLFDLILYANWCNFQVFFCFSFNCCSTMFKFILQVRNTLHDTTLTPVLLLHDNYTLLKYLPCDGTEKYTTLTLHLHSDYTSTTLPLHYTTLQLNYHYSTLSCVTFVYIRVLLLFTRAF